MFYSQEYLKAEVEYRRENIEKYFSQPKREFNLRLLVQKFKSILGGIKKISTKSSCQECCC